MKVIDKRKEKKNEVWQLGDVICVKASPTSSEIFIMITFYEDYGAVKLDSETSGYFTDISANSLSELEKKIKKHCFSAEKVNAHLVVED